MSYEKQNWSNGDLITSEKLNHMEDGISNASSGGSGIMTVHFVPDLSNRGNPMPPISIDKTPQEVFDAYRRGFIVRAIAEGSTGDGGTFFYEFTFDSAYMSGDNFEFLLVCYTSAESNLYPTLFGVSSGDWGCTWPDENITAA